MEFRPRTTIRITCLIVTCVAGTASTLFFNTFRTSVEGSRYGLVQRDGAVVYSQNCARCHGADGKARTAKGRAVGATDLTSADWLPDAPRDTRIVTRGKEDMPAFKGKLKPAEIEAVVSYIRRFKR
ncbi:MAG TPA: cytochrome c [Pyrinomonadaceae bacterium]|nr:cytochrome c [Pyrinomonadaceae bacterium]